MKKENDKIERCEFSMDSMKFYYDDIEYSYANQSMIQISNEDVQLVFGSVQFDENGEPCQKFTNSIRISHKHFERFVKSCELQMKNIEEVMKASVK
ncbi:hypothetical protein CRU92_01580 [Arcobacter sp. FW59]|nr:hypothetical protein CRU92_01580 [Arcobacter sp. FW59]